jgi:hypothetical protein
MAVWEHGNGSIISCVAAEALTTQQFYAVKSVTNATTQPPSTIVVDVLPVTATAILGILQDNPLSGQACGVQINGITKAAISPSQALTGGVTYLEVDGASATPGTLKAHASGTIVAIALETLASTTSIAITTVMLLPANAIQ